MTPIEWKAAFQILKDGLEKNDGILSSKLLRAYLNSPNIKDIEEVFRQLKYYDQDNPFDVSFDRPDFKWLHKGRSFYSEERYNKEFAVADKEEIEILEEKSEEEGPIDFERKRAYKKSEEKLCKYIEYELKTIYDSKIRPDNENVFSVYRRKSGGCYGNVDLLAVSWITEKDFELVAIEVKLKFNEELVQQACNYGRFADRVWIAFPVVGNPFECASVLRESNPLLFDCVLDMGLGILAVGRVGKGGRYTVKPIHWARRLAPNKADRLDFTERYKEYLEEAGATEEALKVSGF